MRNRILYFLWIFNNRRFFRVRKRKPYSNRFSVLYNFSGLTKRSSPAKRWHDSEILPPKASSCLPYLGFVTFVRPPPLSITAKHPSGPSRNGVKYKLKSILVNILKRVSWTYMDKTVTNIYSYTVFIVVCFFMLLNNF